MTTDTIRQQLRGFVEENLIKERSGIKLRDSDSFFDNEVIDSTGVLELVLFIEQTFAFPVEDEEIVPENLDSIDKMVSYVESKLGRPKAA